MVVRRGGARLAGQKSGDVNEYKSCIHLRAKEDGSAKVGRLYDVTFCEVVKYILDNWRWR